MQHSEQPLEAADAAKPWCAVMQFGQSVQLSAVCSSLQVSVQPGTAPRLRTMARWLCIFQTVFSLSCRAAGRHQSGMPHLLLRQARFGTGLAQIETQFQDVLFPMLGSCRHCAVFTGEHGTLRAWDTRTLAQKTVFMCTWWHWIMPSLCMLCCGRHCAVTSGEDGTLRAWDTWTLAQKTVFKPTQRTAARVAATCCRYSPMGATVAAGLADGSIQLWDARGELPWMWLWGWGVLCAACACVTPSCFLMGTTIAAGLADVWDAQGKWTCLCSSCVMRATCMLLCAPACS